MPLETVDRRVVVGRVVTVRRVRQQDAVFEEQHLVRARRIQTADADVRPQAESLLVAHVHTRHFSERLVGRHHAALLERLAVDDVDRSGQTTQPLVAAGDLAGDDDDVLGQAADAQLKRNTTGFARTQRDALNRHGEPVARRRDFVIARLRARKSRTLLHCRPRRGARIRSMTGGRQSTPEELTAPVSIDDLSDQRRRPDLCGGGSGEQANVKTARTMTKNGAANHRTAAPGVMADCVNESETESHFQSPESISDRFGRSRQKSPR